MKNASRRRFLAVATVIGAGGVFLGGRVITSGVSDAAVDADVVETFDEIYEDRRIQGRLLAGTQRNLPQESLLIDGRPLRVMRIAAGRFITAVDVYRPGPTLREVARSAVDRLQGAQLAVRGTERGK